MQLETDLSPSSGTSDSDSEISDDSDSDASSVDIISSLPTFTVRPIRPLPRRKKTQPQVVVLDDSSVPSTNSASSFPNSANSGD